MSVMARIRLPGGAKEARDEAFVWQIARHMSAGTRLAQCGCHGKIGWSGAAYVEIGGA